MCEWWVCEAYNSKRWSPSTPCWPTAMLASRGVRLGKNLIPPPPPPLSSQSNSPTANPMTYPRPWTPLHTWRGNPFDGWGGGGNGSGARNPSYPPNNAHPRETRASSNNSRGGVVPPKRGDPLVAIQATAVQIHLHNHHQTPPLRNRQEEQIHQPAIHLRQLVSCYLFLVYFELILRFLSYGVYEFDGLVSRPANHEQLGSQWNHKP